MGMVERGRWVLDRTKQHKSLAGLSWFPISVKAKPGRDCGPGPSRQRMANLMRLSG